MKRSGRNKTSGTNHHDRWVVEKATSDPTKRVSSFKLEPKAWSADHRAQSRHGCFGLTCRSSCSYTDGGVSSNNFRSLPRHDG